MISIKTPQKCVFLMRRKFRQDELEAVLTSLACSTKPADLDAMLKEADLDADGKINYEVAIFFGKWEDSLFQISQPWSKLQPVFV